MRLPKTLFQAAGSHKISAVLRIRDVYPGSRISDPGSKTSNKREGWKKIIVLPFFVATNIIKLKTTLFLKWWRKNFGPIYKELYNFLSFSSQIYRFRIQDLESGKTYFGSRIRGQKGTRSRIRIRKTGYQHAIHFYFSNFLYLQGGIVSNTFVLVAKKKWGSFRTETKRRKR